MSSFAIAASPASAYLHERSAGPGGDPVLERERIESWRESAFLDDPVLDIRLRELGLTRAEFGRLLADGGYDADSAALDWAGELAAILTTGTGAVTGLARSAKLWAQGFDRLPFAGLIERFLAHYEPRLPRTSGAVRVSLLESLANRLLTVATRTLLLELNVARVHGRLTGDTPEQRYEYYDRVLLTDPDYLRSLFGEYPVLGRAMVECGRRWASAMAELFQRLDADRAALHGAGLLPADAGAVTELRPDLGDPHNSGRAVAILTFASGARLVYKPRPVGPERSYAETVATLNRLGPSLPLTAVDVLDRGSYGWCEFVRHEPCADRADLERFYRRTGAVLATTLLLGAVDVHMENVIAAGSSCMPIDLETLLQPGVPAGDAKDAYHRALDLLNQSVLAIGILPARAFGGRERKSVDVSAIGGGEAQTAPRPVPMVVEPFTDVARIEAVDATMLGAQNRPVLAGAQVRPEEHTEAVVAGFTEVYDLIVRHRQTFDDLLAGFGGVEVRYLPRPTRRYSMFLTESYHPDYLRDARDRDRLLDKLWTAAGARPDLIPIIESEKRQLLAGDIPCFRALAGARDIRTAAAPVAAEFFDAPGIEVLAGRLRQFGPVHRAAQVRIIRESMGTMPAPGPITGTPERPSDRRGGLDRREAAELGDRLVRELADEAILGADDAGWIGVSIEGLDQETFSYKPMATGLYDGIAGMALTYAYAARTLGDERYLDLTRRTAKLVSGYLRYLAEHRIVETVGAYSGMAGLLYTLDHVAHATGDTSLLEDVDAALPWLRECATREECPDLIAGLAGCAIVALSLYRRHGMAGYLEVAAICGERLSGTAVDVEGTAGWYATRTGVMLGGFSHGSAGTAWALYELASEFGDRDLRELADRAVGFDRRLYVPADGAWRDLRPEMAGTEAYPALWCHGAAGIGLSRLLIHRIRPDERLAAEARAAVALVRRHGFGHNHSLCHGDFGALALLDLADRAWPGAGGHDDRAGAVVRDIAGTGLRCGLGNGIRMPGLMLGAAGAGLSLLRLAAPADVPAVAWLEPPRGEHG
ncbi:lanthionine synthetase [Actinoplanes cyaneus]|uniref:Lanthionine synthetase n=1 Tax=Actinoplanes cyaneus TaxID=52696 RepID=A0A919ID73_9ACTN|nr:type 2 lanthipeptide synthetase LanM family protein [Actinoplanes cyaneus]MCW2137576.1 type 2 lantibiotic biosynthesis protein LanM [Actinoplanes cyaneus]GID63624.1 lanthionine synthetase [Actinoplanes cyaneus]